MTPFSRILTVARREFLTTVRRKAFVLTVVLTPLYFFFVMSMSTRAETKERKHVLEELKAIGLVDSSGLYANAEPVMHTEIRADEGRFGGGGMAAQAAAAAKVDTFETAVRVYPDWGSAELALRANEVSQVLVVPSDYLKSGRVRRYARSSSLFSSADQRAIAAWLASNLVAQRVDAAAAARVAHPSENEMLYTLDKDGRFERKDDQREMFDFLLPAMFTILLGFSITLGGQYLLQGVSEEKESRILESLLCTISAEELMAGKLLGLGAAGLLVVAIWLGMGLASAGPALAMMQLHVSPSLIVLAVAYFLLGYLFYGSLMTGIGAMTNSMREAQQFAVWFSFANFVPFIMITTVLGRPNAPLPIFLSMFPPTAATTMMMRMTAPNSDVPAFQIAASLVILGGTALLALLASSRIFRVGLLLYGKTPNLPEILRWVRSG